MISFQCVIHSPHIHAASAYSHQWGSDSGTLLLKTRAIVDFPFFVFKKIILEKNKHLNLNRRCCFLSFYLKYKRWPVTFNKTFSEMYVLEYTLQLHHFDYQNKVYSMMCISFNIAIGRNKSTSCALFTYEPVRTQLYPCL